MNNRYVIGVDFGTLSARAALMSVDGGEAIATCEHAYAHGVMDRQLPDGTPLPPDWALQHPADYMEAMVETVRGVMRISGVSSREVVGIGADFTATTALPVYRDGTPLCTTPEYEHEKHAYIKLWKHHAAQEEADRMTQMAIDRGEEWLSDYGGRISCELSLPKLWQIYREAPQVYAQMDDWVEVGDWVIWQLTGQRGQNLCAAGYKNLYRKGVGHPGEDYFAALDEGLRHVVCEKLSAPMLPVGSRAGGLTQEMAGCMGLEPGTAVAAAMVDAHAAPYAAGMTRPGAILGIIGTSACYMTLGSEKKSVPGIFGVVEDGILPGCFGYEAGQSCVGDVFAWMTQNFVPASYEEAAGEKGISVHQHLTELAQRLAPGESGLLAVDWWNGCRSPLLDSDVSGLMLGLTLKTLPEEIYRALIESTAYGARLIVENFREHGVPIDDFLVTGGIGRKNPMAMQIYADVLGMPVQVLACAQGGAQGSAILAAHAAGVFDSLEEAITRMASKVERVYTPIAENHAVYEKIYAEYTALHAFFGRGGNDVMKRMRAMRS